MPDADRTAGPDPRPQAQAEPQPESDSSTRIATPRRRGALVGAGIGVGVLTLAAAGGLAWSQGLLPGMGTGPSGQSGFASAPDIRDAPEDVWTYTYLPRSTEVTVVGNTSHGDQMFFLTGPVGSDSDEDFTVTALNLDTGTDQWAIDLPTPATGPDQYVDAQMLGVTGDRLLALISHTSYASGDLEQLLNYSFFSLDDGTLLEQTEDERSFQVSAEALFASFDDELQRLDPQDPTGDAMWNALLDGTVSSLGVSGGYVHVQTAEGSTLLDLDTGEEPEWFEGPESGVTYTIDGDDAYRRESGERGSYLERLDDNGGVEWSADADAFFPLTSPSGEFVIFAGDSARRDADATYQYLRRLDPRTGEDMWEEEIEADFDWVGFATGSSFALERWDDDRTELYAVDSGERVNRLRVSSVDRVGAKTFYSLEDERLQAFDDQGEQLWSVRARGATSLSHVPEYLLSDDAEAGRLTRWE